MEDGKTGFLCDPDDPEAFMRAIKRLKEDPELRRQCGLHNTDVVKPFLLENVKEEVFKVIESL